MKVSIKPLQPEVWGLCRERAEKEAFYEGQGSTGGAFMRMALTTLALLNKLSAHPVIKQSFLQPPLVGSAAFNCLHFLELLVSLPNHILELLAGLSNYITCREPAAQSCEDDTHQTPLIRSIPVPFSVLSTAFFLALHPCFSTCCIWAITKPAHLASKRWRVAKVAEAAFATMLP